MEFLLEDPLPIALGGLVLAVLAAVLVAQRGQATTLIVVASVLAITVGMLAIEWYVVTDVEQVENTLSDLANDLRSNNTEAVLEYLAPSNNQLRQMARGHLNTYQVTEAKVGSDLKVTLNPLTSPPSAVAEFTGRIDLADDGGTLVHKNIVQRFTVTFSRIGDRWLISNYTFRR